MIHNGSIQTTQTLMQSADVVVATGGGGMVKAAYSSGKPSYGVGAGNVPVIIDRDVDLQDAAEKIVAGASFDNGIICSHEQFVLVEGAGHSAALHSNNEEHIRAMGIALPISRLVVHQASALTAGGSLTNGFAPTTTLGCGSWGGNSISENLDYKHLMNVSRIGNVITHRAAPTDEEIWAG